MYSYSESVYFNYNTDLDRTSKTTDEKFLVTFMPPRAYAVKKAINTMHIRFNINFRTNFGESIWLEIKVSKSEPCLHRMRYLDGEHWELSLKFTDASAAIEYSYLWEDSDLKFHREWGKSRKLNLGTANAELGRSRKLNLGATNAELGRSRKLNATNYILIDVWQTLPQDVAMYSSVFSDIYLRRPEKHVSQSVDRSKYIEIRVFAPNINPSQELLMLGSSGYLGEWSADRAIRMDDSEFPLWSVRLDPDAIKTGDKYKFAIASIDQIVECEHSHEGRTIWQGQNFNDRTIEQEPGFDSQIVEQGQDTEGRIIRQEQGFGEQIITWELGADRVMNLPNTDGNENVIISGLHFNGEPSTWRGAGVAIPIFSLRSERSAGIGDFMDLCKLTDWASATGQKAIQILPINDTTQTKTWQDSYPYNSISTSALHPLYLSLENMGELNDEALAKEIRDEAFRLNQLPDLDYEAVYALKWRFFNAIFKQDGEACLMSESFKDFYAKNSGFLEPYSAFCYLRDKNGTADFNKWETGYSTSLIQKITSQSFENRDKVAIHLFIQFHLDRQLRAAAEYCKTLGVALKGDIPIGISRISVEAWSEPHFFNMEAQAGAPPDDFAAEGQNWGFPTYNWGAMSADGYAWWRRRFTKMQDYFDLYRIDHILGFFRIWEIPLESIQGVMGHFNPALPLSLEELSDAGLPMNKDRYLKPYLIAGTVSRYDHVLEYLVRDKHGNYSLKPQFDTQRKIEGHFVGQNDDESVSVRDSLYNLTSEVLFFEDPMQKEMYHPRIAAHNTESYRHLNDVDKQAFDNIYTQFFYTRHNEFWAQNAVEKLPVVINASDMLCCAEDLGMIPEKASDVMNGLGIITLEIQRMPKKSGELFGNPAQYPYLSVCSTSTHDMNPIRSWWREDHQKTEIFYRDFLRLGVDAPGNTLGGAPIDASGETCKAIIRQHLESSSILTIIPMQDWISMDEKIRPENPDSERINVPGNSTHYWKYRMHITLENLMKSETLNNQISELIKHSDR